MRSRLAVLAFAAVLLAGCGGSSSSSSTSSFAAVPTSDRSGQTLTIYGFGTGDDVAANRTKLAKAAIAPAKLSNPNGSYDPQRFLTQLASGNVPDLVYVDRQQIGTLAAKGTLQPLKGCVDAQSIDLSMYRQAALDEATFDGQLYALPEFTSQRALIVNLDALHQAGVPLSDVSTTNWDTLKAVAKKLTVLKGGKPTRIGFDPKVPEFFIMWAHANGVDLLSEDGKTVNFTDPKTVEALTFVKSLIDEQGGWSNFKSFRDAWDFFGAKNQVAQDQIAAWPMESWYWNVLAQNSPQVHVAAVPFTTRGGQPFTYESGSGWAIPKGAKHPGLACTFMKTMTSVKAWVTAAEKRAAATKAAGQAFTGLYTANATADRKILSQVYKPGSTQWDKAVTVLNDVQKDAVYWPASPAGAQIQQALTDAITRVLQGQQSPKAALMQAQKTAEQALANSGS